MRAKIALIMIIFFTFSIVGCAPKFNPSGDYDRDMKARIDMHKKESISELKPALEKVGLPYPPKEMTLIVLKNKKVLELWARDNGPWKHVKNYPIYAASGHPGPKLKEGDRQVPEGVYKIVAFNPDSHFDLSMQLGYPNSFDLSHARLDGRHDLGGDIFIHGNQRSIGCIAIGDEHIEQLFVLAYLVGQQNIKVIVAPNDLRNQKPIYTPTDPKWTTALYANIKHAMRPFV